VEIWTVGHSNRSLEEFLKILRAHAVELVVDVRRFPGSRRLPHFSEASLGKSLQEIGIGYVHLPELGGRRTAKANSRNTAWRNAAFRGYADHMETAEFQKGVERLHELARERRTAFMCAEACWWQCHRSLIADYLKVRGHKVWNIFDARKVEEHPFTSAASVVGGHLSYAMRDELPLG
jgi:uncharacterized protein (DUF488 family)